MDTSALVNSAAEAWRRYVSIGAIDSYLLRPHVIRSWVRSHDHGANPWAARAESLAPGAVHRLLQRHARLIVVARPYLHLLSEAAGSDRHAMLLGTAEAIVLDVVGDEQTVAGPERVPGPGALLSEELCGSNGIGTSLVEGRYIEIVSTEHFIHGFHPFTCHGVPIVSLAGQQEGVLSASVRRPEIAERMREILFCAAHGIASELARLEILELVRALVGAGATAPSAEGVLRRALLRFDVAVPRPAPGRSGDVQPTMMLLHAADSICRRLELEQRTWYELASLDFSVAAPMALTREVSELLRMLRPEAERRRVELVSADGSREDVLVLADKRTMRRTLFSMLLHALGAAEDGGALSIEIEPESGEKCTLHVRCTPAPGSPAEWLGGSLSLPLVGSDGARQGRVEERA